MQTERDETDGSMTRHLTQEHKELRKPATAEWVAGMLRSRIARGELSPGVKLPEEELAEALDVSRNTLREGFAGLRAEGIVVRVPNRGVFVKQPDAEDIREMYRARRIIEPASLLWGTGVVSELASWVEQGRKGLDQLDVSVMAAANQEFHRAIVARSNSKRLGMMMERILVEMRLIFHGMSSDVTFHQPYIEHNSEIVRCLERNENALAADVLIHYLEEAEGQLLNAVGERG